MSTPAPVAGGPKSVDDDRAGDAAAGGDGQGVALDYLGRLEDLVSVASFTVDPLVCPRARSPGMDP